MRHFVDLYALFPKKRHPVVANVKELGCNDFYVTQDGKFGSLQSFGHLPPASMLVANIHRDLREDGRLVIATGFRAVKPLVRMLLERTFSRAVIVATILEDLPYPDNEVAFVDDTCTALGIRYRIRAEAADRIRTFRQMIRSVLSPYRFIAIRQAESNQRIAHICGTCRFGSDPHSSVLDRHNRAHGVENLYVVDASFFPSSGGTNPALTVAANALRVADHLSRQARPAKSPRGAADLCPP
jgi:hypothetical protein